jgi:hypothetical protein
MWVDVHGTEIKLISDCDLFQRIILLIYLHTVYVFLFLYGIVHTESAVQYTIRLHMVLLLCKHACMLFTIVQACLYVIYYYANMLAYIYTYTEC